MIRFKISDNGLWYTKSHKNEKVRHLFRIGSTTYDNITIYELIIWKLLITWGKI